MRLLLSLAVVLLAGLLRPLPAAAYSPVFETDNAAMGEKQPCDDRARLAFVAETEAFSQPVRAQVAIMQIVVREAQERRLSVCALTERTNFVSVWRYAKAYPNSWTARQLDNPQTWALDLAASVLSGQVPDEAAGAMHFDGVDHVEPALWQSGQIRFFR